jgi:O-antigen ligase
MNDRYSKLFLPATMLVCSLFAVYLSVFRPDYLNRSRYLGALIFLQVLIAAVWNYRQRFLPLLLIIFFWAGTAVPLNVVWTSGRWFVLGVGAAVGYVIYMKDRHHHFAMFHLLAFFCVLAALVSALVSLYPEIACLKALSLLLLFLYGASGARLAIIGREESFFNGLLWAVEILVYLTAVSYLIIRHAAYGNPNSLGAVMGVVAAPLLLWGIFTSQRMPTRRRRSFAFMLCLLLLFFSQARAAILAGTVSCFLLCLALRRYRLLIQGTAMGMLLAVLALAVTPSAPEQLDMPSRHADASVLSLLLYKGKEEAGILGSRRSPWSETISVIQEHPWFGSGFGTGVNGDADSVQEGKYSSSSMTTREHGNSYLAIMEWVGVLGVTPFLALVLLLAVNVGRTLAWLRRTGDPCHSAVPIALVLAGGLVHAAFEDWLFAVGYYLCVFFWVFAFVLVDYFPSAAAARPRAAVAWPRKAFSPGLRSIAPGR